MAFTTARPKRTFNSTKATAPTATIPTTESLKTTAQSTGGKIQSSPQGNRVEYQATGIGENGRKYKATRYAYEGDTPNFNAPDQSDATGVATNLKMAPVPEPVPQDTTQTPSGVNTESMLQQLGKAQTLLNQRKTIETGANNPSDVGTKYKEGLANTQQADIPTPTTAGDARSMVQNNISNTPKIDTTAVDTLFTEDPVLKSITDSFTELMSPKKQSESLVSEYKRALKDSGLEDINEELINSQKIIEGTEDDIRAEVTAANGFATDSQVMAMANARNKSLIKNFNALVATRDSIQTNLNMMMSLSKEDKQMASDRLGQQMQFGQVILNYKDKMQSNAREAFNNTIKAIGYDGLYQSVQNDPYQMSLVEKTLGISKGQLAIASTRAQEDRSLDISDKALDRQYKEAQIRNINSEINDRENPTNNSGTISGKPQNATQTTANGYADRLNQADVVLATLGNKFTGTLARGGMLPNALQSGDRQAYEQAKKNFVTAVLRRESGASIAPTEFKTADEIYFPQPGDKPDTIKQKEQSRNTVINNFYREADVLRPVLPGQVIESGGKRYKVGIDGETLKEL